MDNNICNICGAAYVQKNGRYVCPACGAYKPDEISNEEDTLLYNAYQTLRMCNFEEAGELFEDIIAHFPQSPKGYWGLVLSTYGIKYETDYDGKKIPTCFAASYESIFDDKNFLTALKLASKEDAQYYQKQAEIIDKNRIEWVTKAKKQKPYDIFISYKDTVLEDSIERTRDSYEAGDLYNHLVKKGYNVFFSRESLQCYGEKYEPYIFNALNTAKVMIIYGTSPENITSTWVKNEWSRYAKKIQNKEKAPNSMVLCYHGFNPSSLPAPLKSMQSIDVDTITWIDRLDSYITDIIANDTISKPHLTKEIIKSQVGKKAATVSNINDRIIGAEQRNGIKYTVNEKVGIADKFLANGIYDSAEQLVDGLLAETPNDGQAIFRKFMCLNKIKTIESIRSLDVRKFQNIELIDNVLKFSDIQFASTVLDALYDAIIFTYKKNTSMDDKILMILSEIVFSYNYEKRSERTSSLLDDAIGAYNYDFFELLLKVSTVNDVDKYCYWLNKMITHEISDGRFNEAKRWTQMVFDVDEGNLTARRAIIRIECKSQLDPSLIAYEGSIDKLHTYECIKDLLKFETMDQQIDELSAIIKAVPYESLNLDFYTELLKYYPENVSCFTDEMFKKGNYYLSHGQFDAARYLFDLLANLNPKEATFYLYIIMAKCRVKNEEELIYADDILTFDEYIPMLANADDKETVQFLNIVKRQRQYHDEEKEFEINKDRILRQEEELDKIKNQKDKCQKVFNRCTKNKDKDAKKTSAAFIVLLIYATAYLILYLAEFFNYSEFNLLTYGATGGFGLLVLLFVIAFMRKFIRLIKAKAMRKRYLSLKKDESTLNVDIKNYKQKYEFYPALVQAFKNKD